ncbi:MAG: transposase-like protein [Loktanella salsilacus]|jgi:putative transposase|uniref:transposase n=1 Tax=Loktanella salsilacus TaxID=195913 RepID=UPI00345E9D05
MTMSKELLDEVREWQSRALDRMYTIVILSAHRDKVRDADSRMFKNKAVYFALGVNQLGWNARGPGPMSCR